MKRYWSQIAGLPLVTEGDPHPHALLSGLFLDPECGKILAFKAGLTRVVSPLDIEAWHGDHLLLADSEALCAPDEISRLIHFGPRRCFFLSKKVLTKNKLNLGRVEDLCFDTATARLLAFDVAKRFLWWRWGKRSFSIKDIQEITENAIVLTLEPEQKQKVKAGKTLKPAVQLSSMGTASTRDAI